jgi:FtsH-binding integral membrane protein
MGVGLGFTAALALVLGSNPAFEERLISNGVLFFGLLIAELALVWFLSARIDRLSGTTATVLFLLYAGLNGVTLSVVLAAYSSATVGSAFVTCAGMFGVMALAGWRTNIDLTRFGSILTMALVGLIIAMVVGFFWASGPLYWVVSVAGVALFSALTAYDVQKVKRIGAQLAADPHAERNLAVIGALALYLDFINLFLFLLRIFGGRR